MKDYYGIDSPSSDFFAHYGVQGMKWGVRKKLDELHTRPHAARSAAYNKAKDKLISKMADSVKKGFKDAVKSNEVTGQYGKGNIDLNNRKVVYNKDGSISTERSFSVNIDGKEVLLPTVVNGKIVSEDEAIDHYYKTGEHLGKFDSVKDAETYAENLHNRQDRAYSKYNKPGIVDSKNKSKGYQAMIARRDAAYEAAAAAGKPISRTPGMDAMLKRRDAAMAKKKKSK